jgi:hypothetical protein
MAQTMLIAIWAVFATINVVLRLACWLLFAMMTWYILVFATNEFQHAQSRDTFVFGVLVLSGATLLQIPLWIAKRGFRFRMIPPGKEPKPVASERVQFDLKDLLIATFIVAIVMSPIRYILPDEGFGNLGNPRAFRDFFVIIPIAFAIITFGTLPGLWAAFASGQTLVAAVWLAIYHLFLTGIEFAIVCAFTGSPPSRMLGEVLTTAYVGNLTQCSVVFIVMRVYRTIGFRFQRVPKKAPPLREDSAPESQDLTVETVYEQSAVSQDEQITPSPPPDPQLPPAPDQ